MNFPFFYQEGGRTMLILINKLIRQHIVTTPLAHMLIICQVKPQNTINNPKVAITATVNQKSHGSIELYVLPSKSNI